MIRAQDVHSLRDWLQLALDPEAGTESERDFVARLDKLSWRNFQTYWKSNDEPVLLDLLREHVPEWLDVYGEEVFDELQVIATQANIYNVELLQALNPVNGMDTKKFNSFFFVEVRNFDNKLALPRLHVFFRLNPTASGVFMELNGSAAPKDKKTLDRLIDYQGEEAIAWFKTLNLLPDSTTVPEDWYTRLALWFADEIAEAKQPRVAELLRNMAESARPSYLSDPRIGLIHNALFKPLRNIHELPDDVEQLVVHTYQATVILRGSPKDPFVDAIHDLTRIDGKINGLSFLDQIVGWQRRTTALAQVLEQPVPTLLMDRVL